MVTSGSLRSPTILAGARVIPPLVQFLQDPLRTTKRLSARHGDFVQLRMPLAVGRLPSSVVFTSDAQHFRQILSDPATWRTVNITAAGRGEHASSRLSRGLVRMRGKRHEYYRRLITPALRRAKISEMSDSLGRTAEEICGRWPMNETVDLLPLARDLMQRLAAAHLFGKDDDAACDIARMISAYVAASWSLSINLLRVNLPGTPYHRFLRHSEVLEARILDWASQKKGELDPGDLLSRIVNSTDELSRTPSDRIIVGHVPTLFGAAYETCQNVLVWMLILVCQHPKTEEALRDEITEALGAAPLTLQAVAELPLLDAVIKESLRILPPVPNQYRVALCDTDLSGFGVETGTRAILSAFLRNRDPTIFTAPDSFSPERWAGIDPTSFQFAVFSAGPRSCPGFGFGSSVLKVALAAILRRNRIVLQKRARVDYRVNVALAPSPAVMARLVANTQSVEQPPIRGRIRNLVCFPN